MSQSPRTALNAFGLFARRYQPTIHNKRDSPACYALLMRWIFCIYSLIALGSCSDESSFLPGTGTLPDCDEEPLANLDGTFWSDRGLVTIRSPGCDVTPGVPFEPCGSHWSFKQNANDLTIIVDDQYRIEGRLCGDELHLRGGWGLPLDLGFVCGSRADLAGEVSIQAEGNVVRVLSATDIRGTLIVQGSCSLAYEIDFHPLIYIDSLSSPHTSQLSSGAS